MALWLFPDFSYSFHFLIHAAFLHRRNICALPTHSTTSSLCCLFSSALHCYLLPVTVFPTCSPYLVDRGYFSFAAAQIILRDRIIIGIEYIDFEFISSFASIPFLPAESLSVLFLILWVPLTTLASPRPWLSLLLPSFRSFPWRLYPSLYPASIATLSYLRVFDSHDL